MNVRRMRSQPYGTPTLRKQKRKKVPATYAPKSYGAIAKFGTLVKEQWQQDGSWVGVVKMPAGMQNDFYGLVNHLTKGDAETKLL